MTSGSGSQIEQFYLVNFPSADELRAWRGRILVYAAKVGGLTAGAAGPRPVVFVPLMPQGYDRVDAYVSEGARSLVREFARHAQIGKAMRLKELPDGLTLLYGDEADVIAYAKRLDRTDDQHA